VFTGSEASGQIDEELRSRIDAGHQQVVAGTGAGDIQQVALGVAALFEIGSSDTPDPLLYRVHLVSASHDSDGAEFQPLGRCIVPIAMRPAVVSIFSANSTAAATATLTALLALLSAIVAHHDPDFIGAASLRRYSRPAILRPLPPFDRDRRRSP
jgi:hypothetical protein